ncbi:Ctr-domain-containing protein [Xylariomycetidae sp. FL2044]|nr:Ctr-domain-containing protein [Xylariomycetidae sp. FL2044]
MTMDMGSSSTTATAAAASSTGMSMDMGGMGGMGGGSHACKISMLWNWYTIDSCFLASSWHITSRGMFAGSCIGVILLTMSLEFLRRSVKEFDRYLVRKHAAAAAASQTVSSASSSTHDGDGGPGSSNKNAAATSSSAVRGGPSVGGKKMGYRPNVFEQAIRAFLHMTQFAVAYFIMLLAMYFNGYIIICIFIGAYLGSFIFHWEPLDQGRSATSAADEPSVCCA